MGYIIRSRDDIILDGVPALSVGLVCDIPPVPPMAQQRYTSWTSGGDTPSSVPDDVYDTINYTVTARVIKNPYDFDNSDIYAFLRGKKILQISRLVGKHFRVQKINAITPVSSLKANEITYKITFVLDPWKYHDDNEEIIVPASGIITNPGTRYSKPIFRCTVASSGSKLTCNGV